eukprot:671894-Amphidinium_carterae.2
MQHLLQVLPFNCITCRAGAQPREQAEQDSNSHKAGGLCGASCFTICSLHTFEPQQLQASREMN